MYEVQCKDCGKLHVYIEDAGQTLQKRMTEHNLAVKQGDTNNGTAVNAWDAQHHVNWEDAKVKESKPQ